MSSTYRVLCLSHDPAVIAADGDWNRPEMAEAAIKEGVEGHEHCDLLIGRYSYPLIELGCPRSVGDRRRDQHRCWGHSVTQWVDLAWLRLLALCQEEPTGTDLRDAADNNMLRCWPEHRLQRLRAELGIRERPTEPAPEVCGHPGPAADDPSNPCTLPLGHDMHRDQDGCSWPTPTAQLLDRTAIRSVIKYVASATGHPGPDGVDLLTDRLWAIHTRQAQPEPLGPLEIPKPCTINHDCPSRARPDPLTARHEARCLSQHRPKGRDGVLLQCAQKVGHQGPHTDFDPDEPRFDTPSGPNGMLRCVWTDMQPNVRPA